jgi:tRNA-modifying protein YgfZ
MLAYLQDRPLEIDAAPGFFPVPEPGRLGTADPTDLAGHRRLRVRRGCLGGLGFGLRFLRCNLRHSHEVCQIHQPFTTLKTKANLPRRSTRDLTLRPRTGTGPVESAASAMNDPTRPSPTVPIPFLGVLSIAGPDALEFLQGQLTSDVRLLADGRTQLAALNTPQGRVVALPRLRLVDGAVYALLPTELLQTVHTLLRRFVLRSKVQVQVAAELRAHWTGAITASAADTAPRPDASPVTPAVPVAVAAGSVAFDYAPGRRVLAVPADALRPDTASAPMSATPTTQDEWLGLDIADGLPQVTAATSGAFVPQMLNLDLLDAISFSKGCYTGQEIVARTQHLGRIKRRLLGYRLPAGSRPAPLAGLYRDGVKAAEVLMSAGDDAGVRLLAVTSLDARGSPLSTEDGRQAAPIELPYPVSARE